MTGHITMRSAKVWVQWQPDASTRAAPAAASAPQVQLTIEHWPVDQPAQVRASAPVTVGADTDWSAHIRLHGLEPGRRYGYRALWRAGAASGVSETASFATDALWQWRTDPPPLRVLAGSCAYTNDEPDDRPGRPYGRDTGIFKAMAAQRPDVTLWMGDNIYFREPDFDDEQAMSARYAKWRALPDLQPLLRIGSHLATWDDHDYGPNDANGGYNFKATSLKLFERYWANPSSGLPDAPGVFTRASAADVEFFILDNRWYRDSDKSVLPDKQMLGSAQIAWLRRALQQSTATWKVIVNGSQMLNDRNRFEGWNNFPAERQAFIDWLSAQKVPGVLMLSGDRHFAAALRMERPGSYPLHEITCSPLTANAWADPPERNDHPRLIEGSVVGRNNFCQLEFSGKRGDRRLAVQIRDARGEVAWSITLSEKDLR